ncbi:hypothetical protein DPMN_139999 [Dreissena polymorpha]|uniref:Uncharacterized protein n=1 Tax=Dreissena polymorpha TaxID=45954 RepID=A0A9D4G9M9_DREPO|nr:hypothetical protein DPMN_139999 [Dreissena polymorpha]
MFERRRAFKDHHNFNLYQNGLSRQQKAINTAPTRTSSGIHHRDTISLGKTRTNTSSTRIIHDYDTDNNGSVTRQARFVPDRQ